MYFTSSTPVYRGSAGGQFEFCFDDNMPLFCKSIEGGLAKANLIDMAVGASQITVKHLSTVEIEPMSIEVGMQDGVPLLAWIRESWRQNYSRKNGHVKFADFDMKDIFGFGFTNALLTETTLPTLDAGGKDFATLKVKMQAETIQFDPGDRKVFTGQSTAYKKEKLWNVSCFRLALGKHDTTRVAKIDGFTVKQGVKQLYTGRDRFPTWQPTKLTFPEVSVHMTYEYAKDMVEWYKASIMTGGHDPKLEVDGSIQFLNPSKTGEVFEVQLFGVGMKGMTIDKAERNDSPRRVKFDLYITRMDLKPGDGLAYK